MVISEPEWKTRKERIDRRLRPHWEIVPYSEDLDLSTLTNHAVEEFPTASGPADYALFVKGELLGILEAKKVSVNPQNVLEQAKRYAKGAFQGPGNWDGLRVPFLYATNGEIIHFLDVRDEKRISRRISHFHTPDALEEFFKTDKQRALRYLDETPNPIERLRPYQLEAITEIEKAIADGKRSMLVAMATGTGKTLTTVSLIYRLLEAKLARRILFLVDRRALAAQAAQACSAFVTPTGNKLPNEYELYSQRFKKEDFEETEGYSPTVLPNAYLTAPQSSHTFVYVSTIQRMTINLLGHQFAFAQDKNDPDVEEEADKLDIPIHAFDVVIADECHRGYSTKETGIWKQVLEHFDGIRIGLTATPAQHTVSMFQNVVYRYTTEQAIRDGYLVDYEPTIINSGVRLNGVFLNEGERVGRVDTDTGEEIYDELEDEREFASEKVEKEITAPDSNKKIIEEIAKYAYQHEEETGRFPKTLIFAANDQDHTSHANQLVSICRQVFNQGDDFVQKITGKPDVDRPLQKIREFRNRPNPKVVVTVDMLSTGIDIPALELIVFLRPVKSRILWVQMLGRGTRRCDEIHKEYFRIFDCFGGSLIEYFKNTTDFKVELPEKETVSLPQVIENIYQNIDREYFTKILIKRLRRIERTMSGNASEKFAQYIPDGDIGKFANELPRNLRNNFGETLKLLRDKDFQYELLNYERAKRSFLVAYEVEDEVTSEVMIRSGAEYQKPEDYLDTFARFVNENSDEIEALQILLEKPKGWNTIALSTLREALRSNKFTEKDLQRAHELVHHVALTDIISMVKHAATVESPLLHAETRVDNAISKITESRSFNSEQNQWLQLIREHLIKNLTLDQEDFDLIPIFEARGGLGKAKKVFGEELEELIAEINYQIAA